MEQSFVMQKSYSLGILISADGGKVRKRVRGLRNELQSLACIKRFSAMQREMYYLKMFVEPLRDPLQMRLCSYRLNKKVGR